MGRLVEFIYHAIIRSSLHAYRTIVLTTSPKPELERERRSRIVLGTPPRYIGRLVLWAVELVEEDGHAGHTYSHSVLQSPEATCRSLLGSLSDDRVIQCEDGMLVGSSAHHSTLCSEVFGQN
jgi:hypothetical protein